MPARRELIAESISELGGTHLVRFCQHLLMVYNRLAEKSLRLDSDHVGGGRRKRMLVYMLENVDEARTQRILIASDVISRGCSGGWPDLGGST